VVVEISEKVPLCHPELVSGSGSNDFRVSQFIDFINRILRQARPEEMLK
jgi:hypothetical protein